MTVWRSIDEGAVASRRALVSGMQEMARTVHELARDTGDVHVVACLQDATDVVRHAELLASLSRHADVVVACVGRPRLPDDVVHVELEALDPLADELSLLVVSPTGGVALVAQELHTALPATTLEAGRAFRWEVVDDRPLVVAHGRRLVRDLGARLDPTRSAELQAAVTCMAAGPDDATGGRLPVRAAVEAGDDDRVRIHESARQYGGGGMAMLAGWLADAGPRAPVLGLVVVRACVGGVVDVLRARSAELGREGDLVVAVPPDAAMLVLPGLTGASLLARTDRVAADIAEALDTTAVTAACSEVPALEASRDLVGSLGRLLAEVRTPAGAV
jgi:hypothetical protein